VDTGKVTELASGYPYAETMQRLRLAIEDAGMHVFAEIDHAAAASSVGLTMPPTAVLIYGNPRGGTPVMQAAPLIALDLPLRVLVRQDTDGSVMVAFHQALFITQSAGLPDDMASNLQKAEVVIAKAIARDASY